MFANGLIRKILVVIGMLVTSIGYGQGLVTQPTSLAELARALHYDPNLIYEYVHNNVEYEPLWGIRKGAFGAELTNYGSAFDQADLMVQMINANTQGNPPAVYEVGSLTLSAADIQDWLGLPTNNACVISAIFRLGGVPVWTQTPALSGCPQSGASLADLANYNSTPLVSITIAHVWVKAYVNGTAYYFDPSFKRHTHVAPLNLQSITGFNTTNYMADATSGASITSGLSAQNINRTNIRNDLTNYAKNLTNYLTANNPAATVTDVTGGLGKIIPVTNGNYGLTSLPASYSGGVVTAVPNSTTSGNCPTTWANATATFTIPPNYEYQQPPLCYKATLSVQYKDANGTGLFSSSSTGVNANSSDLYGQRLTVVFNSGGFPEARYNGSLVTTGTAAQTPGSTGTIEMLVRLPMPFAPQYTGTAPLLYTNTVKAGGTYFISNGWGRSGRALVKYYQQQATDLKAAGNADTSEAVLGSMLGTLSAGWITQSDFAGDLLGKVSKSAILFNAQVGVSGYYNNAPYVDLPGNSLAYLSLDGSLASTYAVAEAWSQYMSIFESTAVQQFTGVSAVSTVKLVDIATMNGNKIYNATSSNFASISPSLVGCSTEMPTFNTALSKGHRLILPSRCDLSEAGTPWKGTGFLEINNDPSVSSVGMLITGGYNGGYSVSSVYESTMYSWGTSALTSPIYSNSIPSYSLGSLFGDPLDTTKGDYLYTNEDLKSGVGDFPQSLGFTKLYSSSNSKSADTLGYGWTHNLNVTALPGSDGFLALGENSAIDAAPAIVQSMVTFNLLNSDATLPVEKLVTSLVGTRWMGDQMINNTVIVTRGMGGEVFVKLPDGTFHQPPKSNAKLILNGDGTYTYDTVHHAKFNFNAAGQATTYIEPSGIQVNFTYDSANKLKQVQNSLGRSLTLLYDSNGHVQSVSDGTRSTSYAYDANGNLTSYVDPASNTATFTYGARGLMTQMYLAAHPSAPVFTNVYDTLGRIRYQTNANGGRSTYFFAGSRSEENSPTGAVKISYLDDKTNVVRSVNALGKTTTTQYDSMGRVLTETKPEGNSTQYTYDDATCASADKRCTNNQLTVTQVAKPGSNLSSLVTTNTYESSFNNIASTVDPRQKTTLYTYTAQGLPLSTTSPADNAGINPVATNSYTQFSSAGFPNFYLLTSKQVKVTSSSTSSTSISYNTANHYVPASSVIDAGTGKLNLVTNFTYDVIGNLIQTQGPRTDVAQTTTYSYDALRHVKSTTDALGQTSYLSYDANGNVSQNSSPLIPTDGTASSLWMVTCKTYSASDKVLTVWGPAQVTGSAGTVGCPSQSAPVAVTNYEYDIQDRLYRVTKNIPSSQGGNRVTQTSYNLDDSISNIAKAYGTSLQQTYQTYSYTNNGLKASVADAKGNLTTYTYDGFDRLSQTNFPDKNSVGQSSSTDKEQRNYDASGNVTSLVRRNGQTISQIFDGLNRIVNRNSTDSFAYVYDLLGHRISATSSAGTYNIVDSYDNAGRLTSTKQGGLTLTHQYDAAGNRIRTTWPDGFYVQRIFDALNRLSAISEAGTQNLATYGYDSLSRRVSINRPNATVTNFSYDSQSGLALLSHDFQGTSGDISFSYSRNQANEIIGLNWNNGLYQWTGYSNGVTAYTVNGLNQYSSINSSTITHDTNGNVTNDGVWNYGYNNDNQLISASSTGASANLLYDADGRLRQTAYAGGSTTNMLYDGDALVGEFDNVGNILRRYVHGSNTDEPLVWYEGASNANKNWLYADHIGSIIATADVSGNAGAAYTYSPYGEPDAIAGTKFRYAGKQLLSLGTKGLYYSKARMYSPAMGRFLQTDPTGYQDDMNLYAYVANNPLNRIDPKGTNSYQASSLYSSSLGSSYSSSSYSSASYSYSYSSPFDYGSSSSYGSSSNSIGSWGEASVSDTYDIGPKTGFSANGNDRIADGYDGYTWSEVKNVAYQSYTSQLRDYVANASALDQTVDLYVRGNTRLSGPLLDAIDRGDINLKYIPGTLSSP